MPLPIAAFSPADGASATIANVGTTSQNVLVATNANAPVQVRINYPGTTQAFLKAGKDNTVAATVAADVAVTQGCEIMSFPAQPGGQLWLAVIGAGAGAGPIYFAVGVGN